MSDQNQTRDKAMHSIALALITLYRADTPGHIGTAVEAAYHATGGSNDGRRDALLRATIAVAITLREGLPWMLEHEPAVSLAVVTEERDGARREVCHLISEGAADPRDVALTRGWGYLDDRPEPNCDWSGAAG